MIPVDKVLIDMETEARREPFPIDSPTYEAFGKDPLVPIAYAGSFDAHVCSFGRDPGRDEVRHGQPQVGPAGRLVRRGVLDAARIAPPADDRLLETALQHVLLSNTMPYKPPGNKAYPSRVKERFRPFVERLLGSHWHGGVVITLGTEAFAWFAPYAATGAAEALWARDDRYESELPVVLTAEDGERSVRRGLTICPLPHPSPLNQRWVGLFPELLRKRLEKHL